MTATLTYRVMADSAPDAIAEAKRRAHDEGLAVRTVAAVTFAGPRLWDVRLAVKSSERQGAGS